MILEPQRPAIVRPGPQVIRASRRDAFMASAMEKAAQWAWMVPQRLPVLAWDRVVGHTWGDGKGNGWIAPWSNRWSPAMHYDCSISSYGSFATAEAAEQKTRVMWQKSTTGVQNASFFDLWPIAGYPDAGGYTGSALDSAIFTNTSPGAMWLDPAGASPSTRYLARHIAVSYASNAGTLLVCLYDLVIRYELCTIALAPVLLNSNAATRYVSAGDPGLFFSVFCQTTLGATASHFTALTYTDNAGNAAQAIPTTGPLDVVVSANAPTSARAARMVAPVVSGGAVPVGPFLPMATGDTGMRKVESYTMSAINTGTFYMLGWRPLGLVALPAANDPGVAEYILGGAQSGLAPVIKDGACVSVMAMHSVNGGSYSVGGMHETVWG